MSERFYTLLLALYPKWFREKYTSEALELFRDRLRDEPGFFARILLWRDLITDAAIAIPSEHYRGKLLASSVCASDSGPVFLSFGSEAPRRGALLYGAMVSICLFAGVTFFMLHLEPARALLIGSHHPTPSHIVHVRTDAIPATELDSKVNVKTAPFEPAEPEYFKQLLVLHALDSNHDGVISGAEIEAAPAALRRLDLNHDGQLTADECGFRPRGVQGNSGARAAFMAVHPALAALDADHDGVISAREIGYAAVALRTLDKNGDGRLTEDELLPDPILFRVTQIMLALDADGDGRISSQESSAEPDQRLRRILLVADMDHDGFVTKKELADALRSEVVVLNGARRF
jgi:hypothetical protein